MMSLTYSMQFFIIFLAISCVFVLFIKLLFHLFCQLSLIKKYFGTLMMIVLQHRDWYARKSWLASLLKITTGLLLVRMVSSDFNAFAVDDANDLAQHQNEDQDMWHILYKNKNTFDDVPHPFLTNFINYTEDKSVGGMQTWTPFLKEGAKNNNYTFYDVFLENTDPSLDISILDCQSRFAIMALANCMAKLTLPYPLSDPENGIRKFAETDEQQETNTELCFDMLQKIYVSFYEKVREKYFENIQKPIDEDDFKPILAKVKRAIAKLFVVHPIIIEYIGNKENLKARLIEGKRIKGYMKSATGIVFQKIKEFAENIRQLYIDKIANREYNKINVECSKLLAKLKTFLDSIPEESLFSNLNTDTPDYSYMDECDELKKEFDALSDKIQKSFGINDKSTLLQYINSCSLFLSWIFSARRYLLAPIGDAKSNFCWDNFIEMFVAINQEMDQIEWIELFRSNHYIWETARRVETNQIVAKKIFDIVLLESGSNNVFNRYGDEYYFYLPAFVKSICDAIQRSEYMPHRTFSVEEALEIFLSQKFEFVNLMHLYWAVVDEQDPTHNIVNNRLWALQKKLIFAMHERCTDELRIQNVNKVQYAIYTIMYNRYVYKSSNDDFYKKFRILLFFREYNVESNTLFACLDCETNQNTTLFFLDKVLTVRNAIIGFVWDYLLPFMWIR